MYTSLLNHLILIAPSFPSRWNTHYRKTLSDQLGKSYSTKWWICQHKTIWYVCIPIRMDLSAEAQLLANTNHYLKFSLTMLPICWHQQTFLVEYSFLKVSSYSAALFPFLSYMHTSCWIHRLHLPLLMTMRGTLLWNPPWWQQRWYVVEVSPTWNYFLSWG